MNPHKRLGGKLTIGLVASFLLCFSGLAQAEEDTMLLPPIPRSSEPVEDARVEALMTTLNETLNENRKLRQNFNVMQKRVERAVVDSNSLRGQIIMLRQDGGTSVQEELKREDEWKGKVSNLEERVGSLMESVEVLSKERNQYAAESKQNALELEDIKIKKEKLGEVLKAALPEAERHVYLRKIEAIEQGNYHVQSRPATVLLPPEMLEKPKKLEEDPELTAAEHYAPISEELPAQRQLLFEASRMPPRVARSTLSRAPTKTATPPARVNARLSGQPLIPAAKSTIAAELNDELGALYYNTGNQFFRSKNYHEAIVKYRKALHFNPNDAWSHYNIGVIYDYFLDDMATAIEHYENYLSLAPLEKDSHRIRERILQLKLTKEIIPGPPLNVDYHASHPKYR